MFLLKQSAISGFLCLFGILPPNSIIYSSVFHNRKMRRNNYNVNEWTAENVNWKSMSRIPTVAFCCIRKQSQNIDDKIIFRLVSNKIFIYDRNKNIYIYCIFRNENLVGLLREYCVAFFEVELSCRCHEA